MVSQGNLGRSICRRIRCQMSLCDGIHCREPPCRWKGSCRVTRSYINRIAQSLSELRKFSRLLQAQSRPPTGATGDRILLITAFARLLCPQNHGKVRDTHGSSRASRASVPTQERRQLGQTLCPKPPRPNPSHFRIYWAFPRSFGTRKNYWALQRLKTWYSLSRTSSAPLLSRLVLHRKMTGTKLESRTSCPPVWGRHISHQTETGS